MTPEMPRPVPLSRIGKEESEIRVRAQLEELPAIAARMRLSGLTSLECTFRLSRAGTDVIEANGDLVAHLTQTCVLTLDEFPSEIHEQFHLQFMPEGTEGNDPDPESVDQVPYRGSSIDLGEAACEQLALALDAYPTKPGATLPANASDPQDGAFVALNRQRRPGTTD